LRQKEAFSMGIARAPQVALRVGCTRAPFEEAGACLDRLHPFGDDGETEGPLARFDHAADDRDDTSVVA